MPLKDKADLHDSTGSRPVSKHSWTATADKINAEWFFPKVWETV